MKWRRISLLVCAILAVVSFAVFVTSEDGPVKGRGLGRSTLGDGSVGYFFSVTNRSNRPLEVRLYRNEAPPKVSGVAIIIKHTIQPRSQWRAALCPPDEPAPWSATLEYFQEPSPLMKKLSRIAAFLHFKQRDPQWMTAQTIQIEEGVK